MTLDNTKLFARAIADINNEQQDIKQNISAEDSDSLLQLGFSELLAVSGTFTATAKLIHTDAFIIDHVTNGQLDATVFPSPISSGLVAYYPLSDTSDTSGNGYNLTNNGSVTFSTGINGNCAVIDSYAVTAAKYLKITNDLGIDGGAITLSAWYKPTGQPSSGQYHSIVCQSGTTTDVNNYILYQNPSGTVTLEFNRQKQGVANQAVSYPTTLTNGTWYNLVFTYDGSYVRAYINGSQVGSDVAASGNGTANQNDGFAIGAIQGNPAGTYYYTPNGVIDEVGVWSRALAASEVSQLYLTQKFYLDKGYTGATVALYSTTF